MRVYRFLKNFDLPIERPLDDGEDPGERWDAMAAGLDACLAWRISPDHEDGGKLSESERASAIVVVVSSGEDHGVAWMHGKAAVPVGVK